MSNVTDGEGVADVFIISMATAEMKKLIPTMMGSIFVERSAASALALSWMTLRKFVLRCGQVSDRAMRALL
jgi:hypothetical protein